MRQNLNVQEWDRLLSALNRKLEEPTSSMPSVHVFSEIALSRILRESLAESRTAKRISGKQLLRLLEQSGLGATIELESEGESGPSLRLWKVGFGGDRDADPLELLQAKETNGVICYFSALNYHNLTTQMVPHHHVSQLKSEDGVGQPSTANRSQKIPRLGSLLFKYDDIPYYLTRRISSRVPGVKSYFFSQKTIIRITDLEQTLLDTLHRPWSCGGASVVMEAWENGIQRLDQERLASHLISINHPLLTRRAGCMLAQFSFRMEATSLDRLLSETKSATSSMPAEFLLPAIPGRRMDEAWNLEVGG